MEFIKSCSTNAQAIGDFEAIAYQAFSITRDATTPPAKQRDWNASEDVRAVETELRQDRHLVAHDASRSWLWFLKPITVDKVGQDNVELPVLEGYRFHREQTAFLKASELARPPMRGPNPHTFTNASASAAASSQKGVQGGQSRQSSSATQSGTTELHPPDCLMLYELFATSVTALVSYFLVKDCHVVSLNYRTFVSKPALEQGIEPKDHESPAHVSWLTSLSVHWTSSGTVIITTSTVRNERLRCLDDVAPGEQTGFVGSLVRVAPNASLARVSSFEDPLKITTEDLNLATRRKRARFSSIEQSIERWKSTVKRWLGWRGYSLQDLDKATSWVRIRPARMSQSSVLSPGAMVLDRDILWPRALCFHLDDDPIDFSLVPLAKSDARSLRGELKWFEGPGSAGFKDPIDCAQEWFMGKSERERIAENRRKAMKAEEEANRRKEESSSLYPSSPLNARTGTYGDLQAVSGVYPTPPDGIVPGPSGSTHDTTNPSTGNTNVILAHSGGAHPAINLSAPQDQGPGYGDEQTTTSPLFPETTETYNTSGYDDDLFNDIGADASGGMGLNEADFDFFDAPDDEDVQMTDVSTIPQANTEEPEKQFAVPELPDQIAVTNKEEASDPLTALENALATASHTHQETVQETGAEVSDSNQVTAPQQSSQLAEVSQSKPKPEFEKPILKPTTPPLSPSGIANALQPSPSIKSAFRKNQQSLPATQDSTFHPLDFSRRLSLADAKYQDGRFADQKENHAENVGLERVPEPARPKSLRDIPLMTKLRYAAGIASTAMIPEVTALARVMSDDSDTSSETSEESGAGDEEEDEAPAGPPPFLGRLIIPAKRKLPTEGNATPQSVTSFAESLGGDWFEFYGLQLDDMSLASLEPNSYDWSMLHLTNPTERSLAGARYVMPSLPPPPIQLPDTPTSQPDLSMDLGDEKPTTSKDSIVITQIVTDQLVYSTLDLLGEETSVVPHATSAAESRWQNLVRTVFPNAADCGFPALAAVHDVYPDLPAQVKGQQRPPPRKPTDSAAVPGNQMYQINSPFVRVRRVDNYWDLLPPSIAFWEALGLAPASSAKNVVAFCVYPQSESLKPLLDRFLLNLQIAYDTCKLGTHLRVDTVSEYELGLVPFRIDPVAASPKAAFQSLKDTCIQLGKILAIQCAQIREQLDAKVDAFVIYMIDPFGDASALWELCSAFWSLYHAYGQINTGRQDQTQRPDLVLQIVPIGYIASFDCPVVLDASTYFNLAREVYDRCPPSTPSTDKTPLNIYKAPAFQLEEGLPRGIPFKLVSEPPQDLMRENSYMHLAYSISLDGTWVTAAWTDNCGKSQAVVSYHLGTRVFGEVAKEIWQTTIEILQSRRVQWRVCIAKSGSMDREELETWVFLITCPTQVNLFLTLLTVNTDAPYKLTPSAASTAQPSTTSPGSTPQSTVSPDPTVGLTPAATPSAEAPDVTTDPEARLVDITDETWGVILAHRLHNSPSTNQFNPALISGLLVKRGETLATSTSQNPTTGPIVVAVNILWIGAVGSTRAATSPFPPSADGVSPSGAAYGNAGGSAPPSPGPGHGHGQERSTTSLMWTPTVQTRATAENLLKEVLGQYRGLGLLAKLRGMKGTRHGTVPWHVVAAQRGVDGLGRVVGGS